MTPIESAFLADVIANPDDDTARLIYADWLEDNGQRLLAQTYRWAVRENCHPYRQPSYRGGALYTFDWTVFTLPNKAFTRLPFHPRCAEHKSSSYKEYPTYQSAMKALMYALRKAKLVK